MNSSALGDPNIFQCQARQGIFSMMQALPSERDPNAAHPSRRRGFSQLRSEKGFFLVPDAKATYLQIRPPL